MRLRNLLRPIYLVRRTAFWVYQKTHPHEPWPAQGAIRFLEQHLEPSSNGFEWGSGKSTLQFARRVAHLTSIEHDAKWRAEVGDQIREQGISNVDLRHIPLEHDYRDLLSPYETLAVLLIRSNTVPKALIVTVGCHKTPHWVPKITLTCGATFVTLIAAEAVMRSVMPQDLSSAWLVPTERGVLMNKAGGTARHAQGSRLVTYRFNEHYLRGGPITAGASSVLWVGDSFTFGWLVAEEETFVSHLNRLAQSEPALQERIHLLNAGVLAVVAAVVSQQPLFRLRYSPGPGDIDSVGEIQHLQLNLESNSPRTYFSLQLSTAD